MSETTTNSYLRPLIFGEVLFDNFPDGAQLGGAPFNVAWHLTGFGFDPLFISRIGNDEPGDLILARMDDWGMDLSGIQRDDRYPTGLVQITGQSDQPEFEIIADQAYDFIDSSAIESITPSETLLLYYGSLALRNPVSRETLFTIRAMLDLPTFIDVNIRQPWWDGSLADVILENATWVKLNGSELDLLIPGETPRSVRANYLCERLGSEAVFLTKGNKGAVVVGAGAAIEHQVTGPVQVIDTVGAGDAFSAVAIIGQALEWNHAVTLARAMEFAEVVCSVRGSLITDQNVYEDFADRWQEEQ